MSLINAMQGAGLGGVQSPQVQQLQQKLQAQQAQKNNPVELNKIQNTPEFEKSLGPQSSQNIDRPSLGEMVERGVDHVDAKQKYAANQVQMLMTGESDNLHHAMVSMEESGVSFNLMLETRNKLMEAYQQLMRLRV